MRRAWLLALLCLQASACAASHGYTIRSGQAGAPDTDGFVLLPCNVMIPAPEGLENAKLVMDHEIGRYLRAQGRSVRQVDGARAQQLWLESVGEAKQAGSEAGFQSVAPFLTRRLVGDAERQAVVIPSLVLESLKVRGRSARWQGVEREMPYVDFPPDTGSIELSGRMSGQVPVASLHVIVLAPDGSQVFEGVGGLDVVYEANMADVLETGRWKLQLRRDPLGDSANLREGIAIALSPYLPYTRKGR